MKSNGRVNGKQRDMEGEGKGDGHNNSPGYKSQLNSLYRNSPSEEVRGHWTPSGAEPMDQWMDEWMDSAM